jgi:hypothetical protein
VIQRLTTVLFVLAAFFAAAQDTRLGPFESHSDVGETPKKGSVEYNPSTGEYRITGGGANMWASTDAFHFVWKQISGDITLTADVHFIGAGTVEHRKAALIVRQSLEPDAVYADVARHGDGLTSLQYRLASHAITEEIRSPIKGPVRIRLERHGHQFTMYAGNPAEELNSSGSVTITLHDPVYVGLAVCSHDASILETAVFSNVKIETSSR